MLLSGVVVDGPAESGRAGLHPAAVEADLAGAGIRRSENRARGMVTGRLTVNQSARRPSIGVPCSARYLPGHMRCRVEDFRRRMLSGRVRPSRLGWTEQLPKRYQDRRGRRPSPKRSSFADSEARYDRRHSAPGGAVEIVAIARGTVARTSRTLGRREFDCRRPRGRGGGRNPRRQFSASDRRQWDSSTPGGRSSTGE